MLYCTVLCCAVLCCAVLPILATIAHRDDGVEGRGEGEECMQREYQLLTATLTVVWLRLLASSVG